MDLSVSLKKPEPITNLTSEEQQILEVKYKSKPFSKLSQSELQVQLHQALIRLSVITGWIMPSDDIQDILFDEFKRKIIDCYGNMNIHELMWAIRYCSKHVNNWGKELNLVLIDEILDIYLGKRREVSNIEEHKKKPQPMIEEQKELTEEQYQEFYDAVKAQSLKAEFVPVMLYDWLDKKGEVVISREDKWDYVRRAIRRKISDLQEQISVKSTTERLFELEKYKKMIESEVLNFHNEEVVNLSKKMIVHDYMHRQKQPA
jgi:hypothetical protein